MRYGASIVVNCCQLSSMKVVAHCNKLLTIIGPTYSTIRSDGQRSIRNLPKKKIVNRLTFHRITTMSLGSRFWPSLYIISVTSPLHVCQYVTARYRTCTLRARFLVTKYSVDLRDRASEIRAACIQASSRAFQFAIRIDCIRFIMRIDSNRFVL